VTNTMVDEASQNLVSQPSDAFIGILIMGCRTLTFRHSELWRPQFLSATWLNNFPFPSSAPLTLLSSLGGPSRQARPRRFNQYPSFFLAVNLKIVSFWDNPHDTKAPKCGKYNSC
jgi:hypothetical protein